jgi:hypothetical protein
MWHMDLACIYTWGRQSVRTFSRNVVSEFNPNCKIEFYVSFLADVKRSFCVLNFIKLRGLFRCGQLRCQCRVRDGPPQQIRADSSTCIFECENGTKKQKYDVGMCIQRNQPFQSTCNYISHSRSSNPTSTKYYVCSRSRDIEFI